MINDKTYVMTSWWHHHWLKGGTKRFSIIAYFVAFWLPFPHFLTNLDKLSIYGIFEVSSTWLWKIFWNYIMTSSKNRFFKNFHFFRKYFFQNVSTFSFLTRSGWLMAQNDGKMTRLKTIFFDFSIFFENVQKNSKKCKKSFFCTFLKFFGHFRKKSKNRKQ